MALIEEAGKLGHDRAWVTSLKGVCLVETGHEPEGLDALRDAAQLAPQDAAIRYNLEVMLSRKGRTR